MIARLTDREKKLLAVVIVMAVIIVGYMYVISPLIAKNSELRTSITDQEIERDLVLAEIAASANIDDIYADNLKTNETLKKTFSPYLEDYEIDMLITNIAKDSGVTPLTLNFSEETVAPVTEATETEPLAEEGLEATEETLTEGEVATDEQAVAQSGSSSISSTTVSISASGGLQSCMRFISNLSSEKYISIESVSVTSAGDSDGTVNVTLRVDTLPKA